MIRKGNGSQMGLPGGAIFTIKHTPLLKGNHPISSPICLMGVANTLEPNHKSDTQYSCRFSFSNFCLEWVLRFFNQTLHYKLSSSDGFYKQGMSYVASLASKLARNWGGYRHIVYMIKHT